MFVVELLVDEADTNWGNRAPQQGMWMPSSESVDLYELLQISRTAELETVRRVYRLLARRWHPDNTRTGDPLQFRAIHEAYLVLGDPGKRAEYDATLEPPRQARTPLAAKEPRPP